MISNIGYLPNNTFQSWQLADPLIVLTARLTGPEQVELLEIVLNISMIRLYV